MFRLWIWTTVVLIFQLIVGGITYAVTGELGIVFAVVFVAAIPVTLTVPVFVAGFDYNDTDALITFLAFCAAGFAIFPFAIPFCDRHFLLSLLSSFFALVWAFGAAGIAKEEYEYKEPLWLLGLTALPLGVGTIFGGFALLILHFRRDQSAEPA